MQPYATPEEMRAWADEIMRSRAPDLLIGPQHDPYMRRWWIVPRNQMQNVYLHEILHSDDDRALHDHPSDNTSIVIHGSYIEHTPEGQFVRVAGDVVSRPATALHRLELVGDRAVTLFLMGPKLRDWGFDCGEKGWIPWQQFTAGVDNPGAPGRGCGE